MGPAVRGLPALDPAIPTVDGSCCAPGTPPPTATASDASGGGGDPEVRHPAESEAMGEARSAESEAVGRGGEGREEGRGVGEGRWRGHAPAPGRRAAPPVAAGRALGTLGLGGEPDLPTNGSRAGEEKGRAKEIQVGEGRRRGVGGRRSQWRRQWAGRQGARVGEGLGRAAHGIFRSELLY